MSRRTQLYLLAVPWFVLFAIGLDFERPDFRPYELMLGKWPKFRRNRTIEMDSFGALAFRYHVPHLRRVVHNTFTTDGAGLRNPPFPQPPPVVAVGDSFVVGVGVSDDQTIPRRLSVHLGVDVYNYGTQASAAPGYFLTDPRFAAAPPGVVVFMPSASTMWPIDMPTRRDRAPSKTPPAAERPTSTLLTRLWSSWSALGAPLAAMSNAVKRDNGLERFAKQTYHGARRVVFGFPALIDVEGEPALVQTLEELKMNKTPKERNVDDVVRTYVEFVQANSERGTRVLVAPLPETGDLYFESFPRDQRESVVTPGLFDQVLLRLQETGIATVDLREVMSANRAPYLFLRDDTHYAPHAIDLVARTLAERVRPMLDSN